ncbi:unnamed protein product [Candidula unifasciata]|uniref:F-box domain-containing protein n=1 Tax=Candidula unifasciata TaxID=100452 RepID=A0A8S3Z818_9EUPU|nr:unnamed protein product [Candidula unifasciata]
MSYGQQFQYDPRQHQHGGSQKEGQQQKLLLRDQGNSDLKQQEDVREDKMRKQHTDWNGVLQDLFGMDLPQTAESTHESTSSGVASDVTSLYPSTHLMTTFKGGDSAGSAGSAKSLESHDSGNKSVSASGSPRPAQPFQKPFTRSTRPHPAVPLPLIPKEPSSYHEKNSHCQANQSPCNGYQMVNSCYSSQLMLPKEMKYSRECQPTYPDENCILCNNNSNNKSYQQQRNVSTSLCCYDCRTTHPAFCSESDRCCVQDMSEPLGNNRHSESHFKDNGIVKDRLRTVSSPVLTALPHGHCCGQQNHHNNNYQPMADSAVHSPKIWHKEQQQHSQNSRHSPIVKETNSSTPDMYSHQNHRISPSSQTKFNEFSSPNLQTFKTNGVNKPSCSPCSHHPNRLSHLSSKYKSSEQKTDNSNLHSQTLRGTHLLLTQAQVHTPQPETGGWIESKARHSRPQPEVRMKNFSDKAQFARDQDSTLYLVTGINHLSINQSNDQHLLPQSAPFEFLPNDVLLKIFSHLPTDQLCRCSQVCRHWYNVVWDHPILWTSIIINNPNINIDRALKYLTRRLSYNTPKVCMILEKININACTQLSDRGLQTVAKRCPELRYLDMQNCHLVSNMGVKEVVSRCVNLERLDVTDCPLVTCISLTDSLISQSASRHLQRIYLRYLDMTDCPSVTDQDLFVITSQCTQLLFFYLRRCPLVTDLGVTYISNNCNSLRELSLSDCKNVTDLGMRELAKLHENLRYLSVAKCEKISDQGVIHLARNCSKLRYLNVRGCEAFSDTGLEFLARNCPRLRSLDIGKCDITDDGLYALSMYCPNLRKLGMKSCDAITDKGIVLIAYRCPSLQQLHVQDCCLSPDAYAMVRKYCKRAIIEHTNPAIL